MTNPSQQFIADIYPAAKKVADESGTSLELILAQTAQETGWGQKVLPGTNNLFNVKADASWHGKTKEFTVPEYDENKKMYMSKEKFRVYDSYEDALRDRQKFLEDQPRYAKAGLFDKGVKGNLEKEAEALEKAHYATGPNYARAIINVANGPTMRAGIALATGEKAHEHGGSHAEVLRENDKGAAVGKLQADLAALGFTAKDGSTIHADQHFGPKTKEAVEAFQTAHGLKADGVVGPATVAALDQAKAHNQAVPTLLDARHPAHGIYEQAHTCVARIDESQGRTPGVHTQNFAGSLTSAATAAGLNRIDHVVLSDDASKGWAVQGDLQSPFKQHAEVNVMQAIQTPLEQSSRETALNLQNHAAQQQTQSLQQGLQQEQMQQDVGSPAVR
ncbi:XVIPCD domain-containing protein [Luteibacter sp. UNCMF366Tsu5.1]|uniref:XVIPCD domain-containing protein n=1 Tax=Luteibacter sp. UNCMF366Tsu5.1 TaxID=1502758 RepID=UPI0009305721|nr:XVIPCD domain-containing protein [Luteibacter sp. UNCMF366Tsu5.1]